MTQTVRFTFQNQSLSVSAETGREGVGQETTPLSRDALFVCAAEPSSHLGRKQDCEIRKKKPAMLGIFQEGWSAESRDTRSITATKQEKGA